MATPAPFSNTPSKDDIASNRKIALALAGQATDSSPVGHWTQALARAVQGGVGGMHQAAASQGEQARQDKLVQALAGSSSFGSLGAGDRAILADNPDVLQSVAAKTIGGKLDPSAGVSRETAALRLQALREDLAANRELAPLKRRQMEAEIRQLEQKDATSAIVQELLRGVTAGGGQPSATPQPEGGFQRQSFDPEAGDTSIRNPMQVAGPNIGTGPKAQSEIAEAGANDSMLIPAQTGGPRPQQPTQTQQPQASPDMVNTPLGPMPMERAQQLGFALGLTGKGDAGKIFIDAANANKLSKKGHGEVEEQLINRISDLSDLQNIKNHFDKNSKMLELGARVKATGLSWQAWLDSGSVSADDRKFLTEFQRFRTATVERLNNRIKAFAGAAVSGQEKERMYAANPNERDDPITFGAKLDEQMNMQRAAIARYNWLKTQGLQPSQIRDLSQSGRIEGYAGLDDIKGIYDKRASEIEQQLRQQNPNLQPQQFREYRNRQLKREFGI